MTELLEIKAVRPSPDKVDRVEFHPVQPWLAFVTRGNTVVVWNYESNEVIYDNELGGADEAALQEAALRQRAERDPAYYGDPAPGGGAGASEAALAAKSTASGSVRDVRFFDLDTCFWQLARQQSLQYNAFDSSSIPQFGRAGGLQGRRWLVMACESKLVLHDLASVESRDISRSAVLESKAPTCLAALVMNMPQLMGYDVGSAPVWSPVLAVGTSAGSIYIVNHEKAAVYAKLTGAHSKAVTALLAMGSEAPGGADMLLSASADGSVAVWNPSYATFRGADREMGPKQVIKAHESAILGMTLFSSYSEGAQPPSLKLATTGEDKRVAIWGAGGSWPALAQSKPVAKASCHSVGYAPWGGAGLGVHPSLVLCTGEAPVILGLHPASGAVMVYADLAGQINAGQKKAPKIYGMAVHPTRPNLMAVATNTGAVLLGFDSFQRPPVVALPPQVVTLEGLLHTTERKAEAAAAAAAGGIAGAAGSGGRGAQALTYVMALGSTLCSTALRLESRGRQTGGAGSSSPERSSVSIEQGAREAIAQLEHAGRMVLACSASGRSISVVWPELRAYTVYSLAPTGSWEVIDRGSGNCIAWCSTQPMYAVVSVPNIPAAGPQKTKKGLFKGSSKKHKEADEAAAAQAAARAVAAATSVQVHAVDESQATQFVATHEVPLGGEQPVLVHGGALLGVVLNKPSTMGRAFQFFNWRGFGAVGPELPEPLWVSWEPECTLAALAYAHTIELCRTRPSFERFASLSIADAQSGIWQSRQLFVATSSSVHAIFADPVEQFVQAVQLASFQGGASSKTSQTSELTPLPPEDMRPAGPLVLAGVRHSYLWLADSLGRPFTISLRHPGIRLRALAARGELSTARTIAQRGLHPSFHDDVARFLAAMSPSDGVREALLLPGLTPAAEMALAIRAGNWDRAARCYQAMALGVAGKALLAPAPPGAGGLDPSHQAASMSAPESAQADAVAEILEAHERGGASALSGILQLAPPGAEQPQPHQQQPNGVPAGQQQRADGGEGGEGAGEQEADAVDWDAPLRPRGEDGEDGRGAGGGPGEGAGAGAVGPGEARRVAGLAELGLRFAEAAAGSGHPDAARSALGVLVRYAPQLPPRLLEDLVFRMGQCSMTESARSLARAVAAAPDAPGGAAAGAAGLRDPGVAALLAALVGGRQGAAVRGTLQAAGLAPLAAVYGAVWGGAKGSLEGAVAEWQQELAAVAAVDGAGPVVITPPVA